MGSLTVAGVQFKLDGADLGVEDTTAPYSVSWNTTSTSNGVHTLTAVARDGLGLWYASDPVTVTVSNDVTPPTVAITSPTGGATVAGTIPVGAIASDDRGVVGVEFRLDGVSLGAEDTVAPYSISWNTTTASNGFHALTAVARDAAGNRATSAPVTVTVFNDTTPPTVSITSPASGATVSGTTPVSATASDNVGVAGVQFFVDGVPLGAEDTVAPYSVAWDTTTVANGSHTLTARALDAAGNAATSAGVTVTVSNAPPPPATGTVTRFEETDPAITFTAGWHTSTTGTTTQRAWSGGTARFSSSSGERATFTFTGPSVNWVGWLSPFSGIARVFLDGAFVGDVDMFSPTEEIRVVVFTARDLAATTHTLEIEVTGLRNPASEGFFILVDAFDVPAPTVMRIQETDPSVAYTAGWTQGDTSRAWSGGTAAASTAMGTQATFTFTGTSVTWIGWRSPFGGIARVFLDGVFVAEVDTFFTSTTPSAAEQVQAAVFTAAGLAAGSHTLTIEVTGLKNASSANTVIVVDAFEVTL